MKKVLIALFCILAVFAICSCSSTKVSYPVVYEVGEHSLDSLLDAVRAQLIAAGVEDEGDLEAVKNQLIDSFMSYEFKFALLDEKTFEASITGNELKGTYTIEGTKLTVLVDEAEEAQVWAISEDMATVTLAATSGEMALGIVLYRAQ